MAPAPPRAPAAGRDNSEAFKGPDGRRRRSELVSLQRKALVPLDRVGGRGAPTIPPTRYGREWPRRGRRCAVSDGVGRLERWRHLLVLRWTSKISGARPSATVRVGTGASVTRTSSPDGAQFVPAHPPLRLAGPCRVTGRPAASGFRNVSMRGSPVAICAGVVRGILAHPRDSPSRATGEDSNVA